MKQIRTITWIKKVYLGLLMVIFGGIILHAPISVALSVLLPDYGLIIKSWKEILMLLAGLIAIYLMVKTKRLSILRDPILLMIATYGALHVLMLFIFKQNLVAATAGLAIDLRYLLFFVLVYVALNLCPQCRDKFIKVGLVGALIVLVFAILQVFVLPKGVLQYIGYGADTIAPYLTVDKNEAFIRINSTLRGPNPLGAYAGIVLTMTVAAIMVGKLRDKRLIGLLIAGSVVTLWFSYSRSALLGAAIGVALVLGITQIGRLSTKMWMIIGLALVSLVASLLLVLDTPFISNVLLHENPAEGNAVNSNEGHMQSLASGYEQTLRQPFGAGIGSTGSASLLGSKSEIIENQYLFVAHEVGWLGLGIFIVIFGLVLVKLWQRRDDWLALGVFASGIGLAIIGLFLPVFADDTVSIIWWGLAAIAIVGLMVNKSKLRKSNG